jgi:hypothetical protein
MIKLENLSEAEVEEMLVQNDRRYFIDEVPIMTSFIRAGAIDVFREVVNDVEIDRCELAHVTPPQREEKLLAKKLFEKNNIAFVSFEHSFKGSRADVFGDRNGTKILVECGPCRANKLINYLAEENTELWIVTCYFNEDQLLHIFKRGLNWSSVYNDYLKKEFAELKKIKSPLDTL